MLIAFFYLTQPKTQGTQIMSSKLIQKRIYAKLNGIIWYKMGDNTESICVSFKFVSSLFCVNA